MSNLTSNLVGILSYFVFLVLEGLVLASATRLALRILKLNSPSPRSLVVGGLAQAAAAGLGVPVLLQALQFTPEQGLLLPILLVLLIVLAVGFAEMRRAFRGSWNKMLAPWGLSSLLQLLIGLPAAVVFMSLVLSALNFIFPLSS